MELGSAIPEQKRRKFSKAIENFSPGYHVEVIVPEIIQGLEVIIRNFPETEVGTPFCSNLLNLIIRQLAEVGQPPKVTIFAGNTHYIFENGNTQLW